MQAIHWTEPIVASLTAGLGQVNKHLPQETGSNGRAYWSPLISEFGVYTGLLRAGIPSLSPLFLQLRIRLDFRQCGLQPSGVEITARRFLATSSNQHQRYHRVCLPLPDTVAFVTTSSFHFCGDLEGPIERSAELRVLVGTRDGGLFIRKLSASELYQSIILGDEQEVKMSKTGFSDRF